MAGRPPSAATALLLVALPAGLVLLVLTPPFQVPDEPAHLFRAFQIAEGGLLAESGGGLPGGTLPASLADEARVWRCGGTVFGWDGASWTDVGIGGGQASTIEAVDIDVATGTVWTTGAGGAARRDPESGRWQRYRITNCSQGDNFVLDLSLANSSERLLEPEVANQRILYHPLPNENQHSEVIAPGAKII